MVRGSDRTVQTLTILTPHRKSNQGLGLLFLLGFPYNTVLPKQTWQNLE